MAPPEQGSRFSFPLVMATALGAGYLPLAPGTFGSLVGLAAWAMIPPTIGTQAAAIAIAMLVGSWSAGVAERLFACTDPQQVVIDEVAGMLITLFMVPVGWPGALAGFLLFRVADVIKPFPANRFEHFPGGFGVMADDAMAGVYANLALRALLYANQVIW